MNQHTPAVDLVNDIDPDELGCVADASDSSHGPMVCGLDPVPDTDLCPRHTDMYAAADALDAAHPGE